MAKRNQKILRQEKQKNDIIVHETFLADYNSKTVDISKFKEYLKAKNKINSTLRLFYEQELHRKLKFRQCVYTRKSEDHFLNRIVDTFGKDAVMAYGDWSRSSQMKHFVPTKGVGLRKLIAKKFTTVLVNEFRTSKLCCGCHKELCHFTRLRLVSNKLQCRIDKDGKNFLEAIFLGVFVKNISEIILRA